jgi:Transposase DDE domain
MYVAVVPNRGSPPAILLRESYREAGKTKNRTLANLSRWPAERIEQLRAVLRGDQLLPAAEAVEIVRALPHGHVLAALGTARRIALDAVLPRRAPQRRRDLALALIVARLLEPAAKLATARMLDPATASHSLGEMLGLGRVAAKEVYAALDWLGREQPFIEATLARRHLKDGALLLYDVTSTYLEGRCCELAQHGYSRDHRGDRPQIVIGLMCAADGCPVAVEVFEGNTADPMTLSSQIDKLKQRFKLQRVVMVGDRGLLTSARIEQTLRPAGLDWITALRAPAIKQLAAAGGPLQPSLFDDRDMAEITSSDYPGERLVVCKNPCSPKSGPANARSCWPPPRTSSRALRPAYSGRAVHCAAPRQSARRSGRCWDGATWPSISRSASPMIPSASPKTPSALPRRPRSTASM